MLRFELPLFVALHGSSTISFTSAVAEMPLGGLLQNASLGTSAPNSIVFPPVSGHRMAPAHTEVLGPKATNKFWANWVVADGGHEPVWPMPYALKWATQPGPALLISHGQQSHVYFQDGSSIEYYITHFVAEFGLGVVEAASGEGHVVVEEGLFGIHAEVRGPPGSPRKVRFPIYSGMAYVSGNYSGFTPRITSERAITLVEKVRDGVWRFGNSGGIEFRAYVLDASGHFVGPEYHFSADGQLNAPLEGWLRLAKVADAADVSVLDAHAEAILVGCELELLGDLGSTVRYHFSKAGREDVALLHWAFAHHLRLMEAAATSASDADANADTAPPAAAAGWGGGAAGLAEGLSPLQGPTKGQMRAVLGDTWTLQANVAHAQRVGFLPEGEPPADTTAFLEQETIGTLEYFFSQWKPSMFKGSFYFSGKGFQKVGMTCLLAEKFLGAEDARTQACASILASGLACLYQPTNDGSCDGAPLGHYYDQDWGGIPSRQGYYDDGCFTADFGNACYNDHHYHYGYFVVAAAILVKLKPSYREDAGLVDYVSTLIRDVANPDARDDFFPRFRSFDWFDLHSWSRGVAPSADGKDQESTSEELNFLYGMSLWGEQIGNDSLRKLGTTMLALCAESIQEFFLMQDGNPHHHPDFVRNHVTGIFFQNKVHYTTWFGANKEYIHGIQMLPLSPALSLTRTPVFCQQEWDGVLSQLPLSLTDPWTSILLTGGLGIVRPSEAYELLLQMNPGHMDDGLTRVWALYWVAVQPGLIPASTTSSTTSSTHVMTTTPIDTTTVFLASTASGTAPQTSTSAPQSTPTLATDTTLTTTMTTTPIDTTSAFLASTATGTAPQTSTSAPQSTPTLATGVSTSTTGEATTSSSTSNWDIHACGHSVTSCESHEPIFFSPECLHGGLGCNALGLTCCRFCGFGSYAEIPCPTSLTPTTLTTTSTRSYGNSSKCIRIVRAVVQTALGKGVLYAPCRQ
jgi:endo-1,3(4)-beta-glucanase